MVTPTYLHLFCVECYSHFKFLGILKFNIHEVKQCIILLTFHLIMGTICQNKICKSVEERLVSVKKVKI